MDKERAVPVISVPIPLLSVSFFFPMIVFLLVPIPIFTLLLSFSRPSVSYHNTRSGRPSFLYQAFSFGIGSSNLRLRIYRCTLFSCFWCPNLGLSLSIQHICWERMLINVHRLLSFRTIKFDSPRFNSRLQLLSKNFALIGAVRSCIVPLAIFHLLQLFSWWNHMIGWQLDLPFLK